MAAAFAWGGAAIFVVALAYFVYTFAVVLGDPAAAAGDPVLRALAIDCLLFLAFAAHHSLFARPEMKRRVTRLVPPGLERSLFVWVASALLLVVCAAWQPLPGALYHHGGVSAVAHLAIVGLGIALTVLGARRLDPLDLAGIPQAAERASTEGPPKEELVVSFPYNLVRHPIYFGWVLVVFGVPHMTWSRLLMACLSTAYLVAAIPWEERGLTRIFGPAYEAYRRRVRWRMIPFVY